MIKNTNVIDIASKFKFYSNNTPDDLADQLSFKYSCYILIVFFGVVTYTQYFTSPISCYLANDPSRRISKGYLERYCWVTGTIPITYKGQMPTQDAEFRQLEDKKILYYQWVPIILGIQALLCYLPQLIWRMRYSSSSETDLNRIMVKASKAMCLDNDARLKEVEQLSRILETLLFQAKEEDNQKPKMVQGIRVKIKLFFLNVKDLGAHLMLFYFFVKVLYLTNSIGQILMMKAYLKLDNFKLFGVDILQSNISGKNWDTTLVFPRQAFCFGKVRQLGVVNYFTAECELPINMLSEKFYIFFFFWMSVVSIATVISMIIWILNMAVKTYRTSFVKKYLILNNVYSGGDKFNKRIRKFELSFLRSNGMFILQMLAKNAGEILTADVITQLWATYRSKYETSVRNSVDDTIELKPLPNNNNDEISDDKNSEDSISEKKTVEFELLKNCS